METNRVFILDELEKLRLQCDSKKDFYRIQSLQSAIYWVKNAQAKSIEYKKGQKIYFAEEKRPYTIRACNDRFLICTKPYNLRPETVMYTIVDLEEGIRGTDGYSIGPYSYYTDEDCEDFLKELQEGLKISEKNMLAFKDPDGVIEDIGSGHISYRNRIDLNIVKVI